jgi:hypothetical protein
MTKYLRRGFILVDEGDAMDIYETAFPDSPCESVVEIDPAFLPLIRERLHEQLGAYRKIHDS